jgi:selenocysteine lyase/cysteine desulfurase
MGVLWGRKEVLQGTKGYKVRAVGEELPHKFETGTLSHEGMAGTLGAVEYLEQHGEGATRKEKLTSAWNRIAAYERGLTLSLIDGLKTVRGLTIRGVTSANAMHRRVPTVSFTIDGVPPETMAKHFANENIFVWSGHNYALEPVKALGLMDKGGVLRVGLAHYNTVAEVDRFVSSLQSFLK